MLICFSLSSIYRSSVDVREVHEDLNTSVSFVPLFIHPCSQWRWKQHIWLETSFLMGKNVKTMISFAEITATAQYDDMERKDSCSCNCKPKHYLVIANWDQHYPWYWEWFSCGNTPKLSANSKSLKQSCSGGEGSVCCMHYLSQLVKKEGRRREESSCRRREDIKVGICKEEDVHNVQNVCTVS